ncbi:ABC transporter permease [Tessaracoccus caeni]|uniref:ABC transporter permease n=1 Tax=Tessaracoccus caeni TaxID=3031239 RepID=UPI0023DB6EC0|nr:ABC transporter permease [Tessaracoccus caeni]MDF1488498.1 ABC transporter permease [Tessaracoccus caeni]
MTEFEQVEPIQSGEPATGRKARKEKAPRKGKKPKKAKKSKEKRRKIRTGFTLRDLVHEAFEGIGSRPSRLMITLVGTVLGIASLVVTIGFAQTGAGQIASQFDAVSATRVTIEPGTTRGSGGTERATARIPWDGADRVKDLAGVEAAAVFARAPGTPQVSAVTIYDPAQAQTAPPPVVAGSAELLDVVRGELKTGRFFDSGHDARRDLVVVLGAKAAEKLGINRITNQPAIFIDERPYTVIGILESVGTREALMDSVIMPIGTARSQIGVSAPNSLDIRIAIGAGPVVARQAPMAMNPNSPDAYKVSAPSNANSLREGIEADVNLLFVAIGVVALIGGGLGIANVVLLSVTERTGEIGLRRALGARRRDILRQFVLESLTTGVLGGLIGVALGIFALLIVCVFREWTPVLAAWAAPAGVGVGALVGLVAGTYPAIKAARIEPVDALRTA